jgi:hypothetical protein
MIPNLPAGCVPASRREEMTNGAWCCFLVSNRYWRFQLIGLNIIPDVNTVFYYNNHTYLLCNFIQKAGTYLADCVPVSSIWKYGNASSNLD